jgi:hypothetical protein
VKVPPDLTRRLAVGLDEGLADAESLHADRGFAEPADKIADLKPLQITPKAACTRKLHHIDGRYRGLPTQTNSKYGGRCELCVTTSIFCAEIDGHQGKNITAQVSLSIDKLRVLDGGCRRQAARARDRESYAVLDGNLVTGQIPRHSSRSIAY